MYKNFAASLIPAIAVTRGTGDGSSIDNASEVQLIPNLLKLETFNKFNPITMADEFHGNLIVGAVFPLNYGKFVQYGFCARRSVPVSINPILNWDCINVRTGVDPAELTTTPSYASNFQVEDFNGAQDTSGVLINTDSDATTKTDPSKNWV